MTTLKGCCFALILALLISCTKESDYDVLSQGKMLSDSADSGVITSPATQFGILAAEKTAVETQQLMARTGIKLVRAQVIFSQTTSSKAVDQYLKNGFNVLINYNWKQTNVTVPFPTDEKFIADQAEAFFSYYAPYRSQIPVVVVENEWDNMQYHSGDINDYLRELQIISEIGHKYGFKISGGGITSKGLSLWMASRTTGAAALMWKKMAGASGDSGEYISRVNTYIEGVKSIGVDYVNVHWYNDKTCSNTFRKASQEYMNACGVTGVICNEFGIRTNSKELFQQTVNEIKDNVEIAIAYSGVNEPGKAVALTDEMLAYMNN